MLFKLQTTELQSQTTKQLSYEQENTDESRLMSDDSVDEVEELTGRIKINTIEFLHNERQQNLLLS